MSGPDAAAAARGSGRLTRGRRCARGRRAPARL